jgi:hypothetical protein
MDLRAALDVVEKREPPVSAGNRNPVVRYIAMYFSD